jgi:nucleoside 2-deoxyribosyltransferase
VGDMMKAYLANGLFSESEVLYNTVLAGTIRNMIPDIDLYVPQENMGINDKNAYASSTMIAEGDDEHLLKSDALIAVIDGVEIDSGVACEIGTFSMIKKFKHIQLGHQIIPVIDDAKRPIFALYTDSRQLGRDNQKKIDALIEDATENQFMYRNLYVIGKIKKSGGGIYSSIEDLIDALSQYNEKLLETT